MDSCAVKGARTKRSNLHNAPLFLFLDFGEEVVVDGGLAQMRLQAERQLQEPFPLSRQGRHVGLDTLGRRVVLEYQRFATILNGAHLNFALLQLTHQGLYQNEPIKISHSTIEHSFQLIFIIRLIKKKKGTKGIQPDIPSRNFASRIKETRR